MSRWIDLGGVCARRFCPLALAVLCGGTACVPAGAQAVPAAKTTTITTVDSAAKPVPPPSTDAVTDGSVTVSGNRINYHATAGTITVGATDAQDAMLRPDGQQTTDSAMELPAKPQDRPAVARIFYTAYLRADGDAANRPVTFIYNGGPGSASMYLHMAAFGPRRVVLQDLDHPDGGPYRLVNNDASLLDASDLVFIDAPGTGYSRVLGKDAEKSFYGVDEDAHAFNRFIRKWLSKNNRWTSPKFLFGESYGTTRSAVVSDLLSDGVDLNGVVLLSQILNFNDTADGPEGNPGTEQAYFLSLPSFAATAWFHNRLANRPAALEPFLREVEAFSVGEYATALQQGADLPADRKAAIAARLAGYTGIPAATWSKVNLRMSGAQLSALLQTDADLTTGRLDSRFQGPALSPFKTESEYDPFDQSISAAILAAMNQYSRTELHYGSDLVYKPSASDGPDFHWNILHKSPIQPGWEGTLNVMPDLADAMKKSPHLQVLLMGGYFDLGTLYFGATYEMKHLPMPQSLQQNLHYQFFQTGHMVYVNPEARQQIHDTTAAFIREHSRSR